MPYSAAVFTRKKTDHLVDINNMTLRVGKELYKKLNIIFIIIFIINKYNPSLSAINFLSQYIRNEYIAILFGGVWENMESDLVFFGLCYSINDSAILIRWLLIHFLHLP